MVNIVYGSELSLELRAELKSKVEKIKAAGKRIPCLAVILVGDNPASISYVRGKEQVCLSIGLKQITFHLPQNTTQAELEEKIKCCNLDSEIDGILVQLPLPQGLDEKRAILTLDPSKDVDGLHPLNIGNLYSNHPTFIPCTPMGCMELLKRMNCEPEGKHAVVVGRSKLVGSPVARLLQNANATVTVCHSKTSDLKSICQNADILIAAIGSPKFITHEYLKKGAVVVDVGVNRLANGHLCGDVDFEDCLPYVSAITPVPKGVGPMTITMLLMNTLKAYEGKNDVE